MSNSVNQFDIDQVTLEHITIVNVSINNETDLSTLPNDIGFDIKYNITTSANLAVKKVKSNFECKIQAYKDETQNTLIPLSGAFDISFIFHIENIADISHPQENGLIDVPNELVESLYNITYSTSRGIIYTRCLGTILGKVILPITSTSKLISKD